MAEPAHAVPMPPQSVVASGGRARRSRSLGLIALLLAVVVIAVTVLAPALVASLHLELSDVQMLGGMLLVEVIGMAVVLVLAIIAVVTDRGRGLGIAAGVIALLVNPFSVSLLSGFAQLFAPQG